LLLRPLDADTTARYLGDDSRLLPSQQGGAASGARRAPLHLVDKIVATKPAFMGDAPGLPSGLWVPRRWVFWEWW